jgi:hypothetical protein
LSFPACASARARSSPAPCHRRGDKSSPSSRRTLPPLPKPMMSGAKSDGCFGKQDFVYLAKEDVYRFPAGKRLTYRYTNEEDGKVLRRYWTTACPQCPLKSQCTKGPERRGELRRLRCVETQEPGSSKSEQSRDPYTMGTRRSGSPRRFASQIHRRGIRWRPSHIPPWTRSRASHS